ncbi:hypothetical protein BU25DRAFT_452732 [Macroventuria anomochaeta]|uniref:Uncharacterized protein n=1 Tax=Macroventuria anomochaeta TaxID=301207 RepID=A0ACB6RHX3_9PLEO|nr:uncharacterized protein BU25DRAFT_452732 [Macroventuria anomochaeta]KAF2621343.1 hypothetical protein BU25DRAFT_452732 [Macroventuria anomochaeta]
MDFSPMDIQTAKVAIQMQRADFTELLDSLSNDEDLSEYNEHPSIKTIQRNFIQQLSLLEGQIPVIETIKDEYNERVASKKLLEDEKQAASDHQLAMGLSGVPFGPADVAVLRLYVEYPWLSRWDIFYNVAVKGIPAETKNETSRPPRTAAHSQWPILLAIFCVLASSTGAGLVVYLSDGKPTTSWKTRPSVLLAILAPIITISVAFLLSTAFSISWWRAAESGTTIEHLNRIWDRAFWLRKSTWKTAVFSTNGFMRLAIVSLLVPVGNFLYNPLFQLSTTESCTGTEADAVSLTLDILPEISKGLASLSCTGTGARMDFTAAAVQWYRGDPIRTKDEEGYRCEGTCQGTVVAPGIVATCTNKTTTMDLT